MRLRVSDPPERPGISHDAAGHGTLSAFHAGCHCGWCESRCWERLCGCATCVQWRAISPYVELPTEVGKPAARRAVR